MRIELGSEIKGSTIVRGIRSFASAKGAEFMYTPVTVAYANIPSSEVRRYNDIEVMLGATRLIFHPSTGGRSFDSDEGYDAIEVAVVGPTSDEVALLIEELAEAVRGVQGAPPEEADGEGSPEYVAPPVRDYSSSFRLLVVYQDHYGRRILDNIRKRAPPHWTVDEMVLSRDLPTVIDDPSGLIPLRVPEADLVLFLPETPNASQLAGDIVRRSRARAIIAPIDNSDWMPPGQVKQLERCFDKWGVEHAFPRPFCSLREEGKAAIDEFAREFGRPAVELMSEDGKTVSEVRVIRGAPCGCTFFVAENLKGERLDEAVEKAGLLHHHYPCLASMVREQDLDDTLMHASGYITKSVVEEQIKKHLKRAVGYIDPSQFR